MKSKSNRLVSALLTAALVIGMLAAMPQMISAATTHSVSNATELGTALAGSASGDTIRLMADITYSSSILIDAKTITFDLNGKTLNATGGLAAVNGAKILLANPANGQFNVSGKSEIGNFTVFAMGGSKAEVSNISTSVNGVWAAYTYGEGGVITVFGNLTHIAASGIGVYAASRSEITVNGKITVSPGVTYARVEDKDKTKMGFETTTSRPAYLEYTATVGSNTSYFWLRQQPPVQVTLQPVGATYKLNEPATPLKATFEYDAMEPYGKVQDHATEAPIKVTWYWSATDSNTGRTNVLSEEPVMYSRQITHTTTITPKTDTVGVRYYYAVLTYKEEVTIRVPTGSPAAGLTMEEQTTYVPREAVTAPARIEVTTAPGGSEHDFRVRKVDENGNLLSGAVISLVPNTDHQQEPSVITHEVTTVGGYADFTVTEGYYILSEKQAPAGYNATDDRYYINVNPDGVFIYTPGTNHFAKYEMVTFVNKPIPGLNDFDHFAFMQGYPSGVFRPLRNMTRAEAVVMFSRLLSEKMNETANYYNSAYYPDVRHPDLDWFANQVCFMHEKGVLAHFSRDGRFRPNEPVTRAEFATLAAHFANLELTSENKFSDVPADHWAVKFINSAAEKGWITGYSNGTFRPEANINRAEVVTLVGRMLNRVADEAYLLANVSSLPRTYSDIAHGHWAYLAVMEASIGHDYKRDSAGIEHWTAVRD